MPASSITRSGISLQKIWVCMTNGNCHGKYKICHKKYLMTKKQRHADRHITTVT